MIYRQDRISIRPIGASPIGTFVAANIFTLNTVYNVYLKEKNVANLKLLLAIINSNATRFFWKKSNSYEKKTFPKVKKEAILSIPIPAITKDNKSLHDEIVKLVDTMLHLQQQKQNATLATEQEQLTQRIQYIDKAINKHV